MVATEVQTKVVHAVCSHDCPDSCAVLVTVESITATDGTVSERAVKVAGDPSHPVTQGFLCAKVAQYLDRVYSPDRLLYPMRRKPGATKGPAGYGSVKGREADAFERISWDEALDHIAQKLSAIAAEFGPESILPYSYAGTIGQLGFGSMDRRFFHRLGASQLARTICSEAGGVALKSVYGVKLGTRPEDFAHAGMVIAWGANIHGNNIHLWPFIEEARRKGARLVVIDPYRTRTAAVADDHIAIRPGTDTMLALSLMHVIFRDGLEDAAYMAECTAGAAELRAHALNPQHAPAAAAITGIAAEKILALAREYALCLKQTGKPAVIRLNYGIQRSENGGTAARAVCMLPLVTGAWKHKGGGLQLSTSGAFPFNSDALQMPELMRASPLYTPASEDGSPGTPSLGRDARVVNMSRLGDALTGIGTAGRESEGPRVKAMFVYNSNPAAVAPNQNAVLRGMMRADLFTVVHEQFFTDTADYADVLLPAPTFLEVKDVQGAYGHLFAQVSQQAIAPLGEARSNVRMFGELARRMGFTESCFNDTDDDLIDQALSTEDPWFAGITRERLEREGHIPLALPVNGEGETLPFSTADWLRTPSGRGELTPVPVFLPAAESRGGLAAQAQGSKYPLEFLPRKSDNYMNSTFANIPRHQKMEARTSGTLEMHPVDAKERTIANGDAVEVFNGRGTISLRAQVGDRVPQGVVAARLNWNKLSGLNGEGAGNVNALTSETLTDIGGGATFYSTLVEVRRSGQLP